MCSLLVGFDSAWTPTNSGALVGVLRLEGETFEDLGSPQVTDFDGAHAIIRAWQAEHEPTRTLVLLDQPTIVVNAEGQRPVENIVGSPVGLRYGGVQPANTGRADMFGTEAPVWLFLQRFGGPADPLASDLLAPASITRVIETYPVLALIALKWILPDARPTGRLPKYNPKRKKNFSLPDWQYVCLQAAGAFRRSGLVQRAAWLEAAATKPAPDKFEQDGVDACLCLLVALHIAGRQDCLMIGDLQTGYMVVPHCVELQEELETRCRKTNRAASENVRVFRVV